jgi:hypothetical protein
MDFTFAYNLSEHGWADVTIQNEGHTYHIDSISYVSDAFRALGEAICRLINGCDDTGCSFDHEPGATRIRFRASGNTIHLIVYRFDSDLRYIPWEKGKVQYTTITALSRITSQYLEAADRILRQLGVDEYMRRWGYPFPLDVCDQIKKSGTPANPQITGDG